MPPKLPKFNSNDVQLLDDRSLFIKDLSIAKAVYDATQLTPNMRLVVNGNVLYSKPAGSTSPCSTTATTLFSTNNLKWDSEGCLVVLDARLSEMLEEIRATNAVFRIDVPLNAIVPDDKPGGGIGENKINAMCLC